MFGALICLVSVSNNQVPACLGRTEVRIAVNYRRVVKLLFSAKIKKQRGSIILALGPYLNRAVAFATVRARKKKGGEREM